MATGYEVKMYADISRVATALESVAGSLDEIRDILAKLSEFDHKAREGLAPETLPKLPQSVFNMEKDR